MSAHPDPRRGGRRRRSTAPLYEPFDTVLVRAPLLPVEAYRDPPPVTDALVRSALAVSSPDLLAQLDRDAARNVRGGRASRTLLRYLIRMSSRPTPFGMFAGVGLARLSGTTELAIGTDQMRTRTRPDMEWLLAVVATLESRPEKNSGSRRIPVPGCTGAGCSCPNGCRWSRAATRAPSTSGRPRWCVGSSRCAASRRRGPRSPRWHWTRRAPAWTRSTSC